MGGCGYASFVPDFAAVSNLQFRRVRMPCIGMPSVPTRQNGIYIPCSLTFNRRQYHPIDEVINGLRTGDAGCELTDNLAGLHSVSAIGYLTLSVLAEIGRRWLFALVPRLDVCNADEMSFHNESVYGLCAFLCLVGNSRLSSAEVWAQRATA